MRELTCTECVELCTDVALGVADAKDRAGVLSHVERCAGCGTQLRSMTEVADGLAALVPPVPPPPGFDERVLEAISKMAAPPPAPTLFRRVRAKPFAVAAAVAAAVLIAIGGWTLGRTASTRSSRVVTASLLANRRPVGDVTMVPGDHPWLLMDVDMNTKNEMVVRCDVRTNVGELITVGTFSIVHGYADWAVSLPPGTVVRAAELVTTSGRVLASATVGT